MLYVVGRLADFSQKQEIIVGKIREYCTLKLFFANQEKLPLPYYKTCDKIGMKKGTDEMKTEIAKNIETTSRAAQYDDCVKKLLSEKIILAWILKECVEEFKPFSVGQILRESFEDEPQVSTVAVDQDELDFDEELADNIREGIPSRIEGMNVEDSSIREGKVFYDIRFSARVPCTKEPIRLIINLEAQKSDQTPYPILKRAIYYVSRMISSQKNRVFTNSHYEKIRKVVSIWIQMNVEEDIANTITEYGIAERNIVGNAKGVKEDYDLLSVVMLRLGNPDQAKGEPILRLLDVLLSAERQPDEKKDILEKDFDIPMTVTMKEEVQIMCNLGEGLYEKAYEEACEKVYVKAYEKAEKEKSIVIAQKMLARGKATIEEIAEDTGLSVEEVEALNNLQTV